MLARKRLSALLGFLAVIVLFIAFLWPSPSTFTLLADSQGSLAHDNALRLKQVLASHGIDVAVVATQGTAHNLRLLQQAATPTAALVDTVSAALDPKVAAFERTPSEHVDQGNRDITSLGAMYLQPLWVFTLADREFVDLSVHQRGDLGVGGENSSSRLLAELILSQRKDDPTFALVTIGDDVEGLDEGVVAHALEDEVIVAALLVGHPGSNLIKSLMGAGNVQVVSMQRTEAFALHFPFLTPVRLPQAGVDLRANIPSEDITTLGASTELLVNSSFPLALVEPVLHASRSIYGGDSLFATGGTFPGPDMAAVTLNSAAERYYTEGPTLLRKVLPYWLATWVERFLAIVVSVGTLLIAVFSILPKLILQFLQRHLDRAYRDMEGIEKDLAGGVLRSELLTRIAVIDERTRDIRINLRGHVSAWLEMRQFLYDLKERIVDH